MNSYSNQFPIGKNPVGNKLLPLYNIEVWSGTAKIQTLYLNAPYGVCVVRKRTISLISGQKAFIVKAV